MLKSANMNSSLKIFPKWRCVRFRPFSFCRVCKCKTEVMSSTLIIQNSLYSKEYSSFYILAGTT